MSKRASPVQCIVLMVCKHQILTLPLDVRSTRYLSEKIKSTRKALRFRQHCAKTSHAANNKLFVHIFFTHVAKYMKDGLVFLVLRSWKLFASWNRSCPRTNIQKYFRAIAYCLLAIVWIFTEPVANNCFSIAAQVLSNSVVTVNPCRCWKLCVSFVKIVLITCIKTSSQYPLQFYSEKLTV